MTAAQGGVRPATDAALIQLDFALFDRKCAEKGATNEVARAELVGVNRITLWRWRVGHQKPNLEAATRIAHLFDTTVEELIGGTA